MDTDTSAPGLDVPEREARRVSRRILEDPEAEVVRWRSERIDHESIIDTTGGLHVVSGVSISRGEEAAWSCVAKVVLASAEEGFRGPGDWAYWRREACFFEAGASAWLPSPLRAPVSFGVSDHGEGECWIWMEHVAGNTVDEWRMDDFHRVARANGEFAGAYVMGRSAIPSAAWLASSFFASALAPEGLWANFMDPANDEGAWSSDIVNHSFGDASRARVLSIWHDRDALLEGLDRLPRTLCHNDFHRRNVMLPVGGDVPVVVDWAFCGPGAVGSDLGQLVVVTLFHGDVGMDQAGELETVVLDGFLDGLRRSGWDGDDRLVRMAYATVAALWMGASLPGWVAFYMSEPDPTGAAQVLGKSAADVLARWVALSAFALDLGDEARVLARTVV